MTKPQATLYWHTTYRPESNNVIRSSKSRLIMKLVMSRCHTHTSQNSSMRRSIICSAPSPLRDKNETGWIISNLPLSQNHTKWTQKRQTCVNRSTRFLCRPRWQTTKLFTEPLSCSENNQHAPHPQLWRQRFKLRRSLPLWRLVCRRATTITTTTTTTDEGVNRASSKSRRRAVTGRDELSLTQRQRGGREMAGRMTARSCDIRISDKWQHL